MKVTALAGGVGGAKLADGLARILPPNSLTVIVNTGDDFDLHGLRICPDLDTVMYTLAGIANPQTGWGIVGDTFEALAMLARYGGDDWFRLGDRDLATHITRTAALRRGEALSQITARMSAALGIRSRILPMTDDPVATMVDTAEGELAFQDYFVRRRWQVVVHGLRFAGIETARPAPGIIEALQSAETVILCPSNPFLSIDPILRLQGVRPTLAHHPRVVAISPIVGGKAIKGPAAKMMAELGLEVSPISVVRHYADFLTGFVLDEQDANYQAAIEALGLRALTTNTLMHDEETRARVAQATLDFALSLRQGVAR